MRLRDETGRWSVPLLALVLYRLAAGAAAVNCFVLALLSRWMAEIDASRCIAPVPEPAREPRASA